MESGAWWMNWIRTGSGGGRSAGGAVGLQGWGLPVWCVDCRRGVARTTAFNVVVNGLVQISQAACALRLPLRQRWATTPDTSDQLTCSHTQSLAGAVSHLARHQQRLRHPKAKRRHRFACAPDLTGIDRRAHLHLQLPPCPWPKAPALCCRAGTRPTGITSSPFP